MIGEAIKSYLKDNGITQTFISSKTGIKMPILSAMLSGKRKIYAEEYLAICKVLEVPLDTFNKSA